MPAAPYRPCRKAGCGEVVQGGGWCDAHSDQRTGWNRTNGDRTAAQRGYGVAWRRIAAKVMKRDKGLCQPCLRTGRYMVARQVDHIISKGNDGTDDMANCEAICIPCHKKKTISERAKR